MCEIKYPIECFGCRYYHGGSNYELCPPCDCKARLDIGRQHVRSMSEKIRKRRLNPCPINR